jgi:hypothetical protein
MLNATALDEETRRVRKQEQTEAQNGGEDELDTDDSATNRLNCIQRDTAYRVSA